MAKQMETKMQILIVTGKILSVKQCLPVYPNRNFVNFLNSINGKCEINNKSNSSLLYFLLRMVFTIIMRMRLFQLVSVVLILTGIILVATALKDIYLVEKK